MDLKDFMENPAGKGDSSTSRTILRKDLDDRYDRLMKNPKKRIQVSFYKTLKGGKFYIHLVIPSETERNNSYDVVFQFSDDTGAHSASMSIINYDIRVFCNAPSFAYTFAKVYMENDMMIKELSYKYGRDISKKMPVVRNRYNIVNYDKYAYFGAKYLHESRLLNKATLSIRSVTYSASMIKTRVRDLDTIMAEYKKAQNKLVEKKKAQSKEAEKERNKTINKIIGGTPIQPKPIKTMVQDVRRKTPKAPKTKSPKAIRRVGSIKKK